jgi:hypothetical protein
MLASASDPAAQLEAIKRERSIAEGHKRNRQQIAPSP